MKCVNRPRKFAGNFEAPLQAKFPKLFVLLALCGCFEELHGKEESKPSIAVIKWEKAAEWPHDTNAFTQGLEVWDQGHFLESIGQYGKSEIRKVEIKSGKVVQAAALDGKYFAEGAIRLKDQILQLTWREGEVIKWNIGKNITEQSKSSASFKGEGWGLTKGEGTLWVSNGTSEIQELDVKSLKVKRTFRVTLNGQEMDRINELEFINGKIFANVWMTSTIIRFSPKTGIIDGLMDISSLVPPQISVDAVPNGIAWDSRQRRLYVTGKLWPKVFELKLLQEI